MSGLRLGAIDLAPKEVAFVRALVRLFAHTEKLGWSFADAPPYHAVITDPRARAAHAGFFAGFAGPVLTLVDGAGAPALDTVAYPIRANQFRDWLKLRQDGLPVAPPAAPVQQAAAPPAAPLPDERRFKLRRWPSPALLRGDPAGMRMASLMSRTALSTGQLAAMLQQPEERCRAFVAVLQEAGLLQETAPAAVSPGAITAAAPVAPPVRAGLMASLRRHLGL